MLELASSQLDKVKQLAMLNQKKQLDANKSSKQRILIVDSLPENLRTMSENLKNHYRILAATNIEKALQIMQKSPLLEVILINEKFNDDHLAQQASRLNIPLLKISAADKDQEYSLTQLGKSTTMVSKLVSPEQLKVLLAELR
jgi:response regulator RpfG family c-di-GMP phosphodiesterase